MVASRPLLLVSIFTGFQLLLFEFFLREVPNERCSVLLHAQLNRGFYYWFPKYFVVDRQSLDAVNDTCLTHVRLELECSSSAMSPSGVGQCCLLKQPPHEVLGAASPLTATVALQRWVRRVNSLQMTLVSHAPPPCSAGLGSEGREQEQRQGSVASLASVACQTRCLFSPTRRSYLFRIINSIKHVLPLPPILYLSCRTSSSFPLVVSYHSCSCVQVYIGS